jgi:hypothetical protein
MKLERAWSFSLDGHVFYVLSAVRGASLVYDTTTGQWLQWVTGGRAYWNMFSGITWRGRVLAADASSPSIWELDPATTKDEGSLPIERTVTGFQPIRGRESAPQGSLRITAHREGPLDPAGVAITMRFSDDGGATWSQPREVTMLPTDYSKRIEYRSLGRLRAPGRIWEFTDAGGLVSIEGADTDIAGQK